MSTLEDRPIDAVGTASSARHATLLRIVRQLTDESDPDTLMRCLVDEAVTLLRGQVGSVACWNEEEGVLKRVWSTIPLVDDPRIPPDLRGDVSEIISSAQAAAATVDQLRRVTRLEESDASSPEGQVLNLARSVGDDVDTET
jgi:hypothetical protein